MTEKPRFESCLYILYILYVTQDVGALYLFIIIVIYYYYCTFIKRSTS